MTQLAGDLEFVREAVRRSEGGSPRGIYFLWAALVLVGFPLVDLAPRWVGTYWTAAGPLGGVASAFLGWRAARRRGELRRREGVRQGLHWGGMLVAIFLSPLLVAKGLMSGEALSAVILLLLALGYFLAGVHLEPPLRWIGILLAAGYVLVLTLQRYAWTVLGILVAVAMVAAALLADRGRAPAEG